MVWYRTPVMLLVHLTAAEVCLLEIGSVLTRPFESSAARRLSARGENRTQRINSVGDENLGLMSFPAHIVASPEVTTVRESGLVQWGKAVYEGSDPEQLVTKTEVEGGSRPR